MEEFEAYRKLVEKAQEQLGDFVTVSLQTGGWSVIKEGSLSEDLRHGTFEQAVAKLKEWGTPPPPSDLTITVPFSAMRGASRIIDQFGRCEIRRDEPIGQAILEAVAPYEPQ